MWLRRFGTGLRKTMLLCLVFLALAPHISLADVVLTDEEYKELDQRLERAEELQKSSKQKIQSLEKELTQAKKEQESSNKKISSLESDLKQAKESQKSSKQKIQSLEMNLASAEKSLKQQKKDQTKKIIKTAVISFVIGTAAGIITDNVIDHYIK